MDELLAQLASSEESTAEAASELLAKQGEGILPQLQARLRSSDADQRWWAVRTLARMPASPSGWFRAALDDPAAEVREAAALALAAHPDEESAPALIQSLSDDDSMVGTLSVNALVAIGKACVPSLLEAFEQAAPSARINILRTLAEIRDHRAIPLMMRALDSDSAMMNYWAREGLEQLGLNMIYIKPG